MHGGQGWLKEAGAQVQVDVCVFGELRGPLDMYLYKEHILF